MDGTKSLDARRTQERARLSDTSMYPALEEDQHSDSPGVLLSDEISYYVDQCKMVDPFCISKLKPASYELSVGDRYFLAEEFKTLKKGECIEIPPFEVAVIQTRETLNLPRFMIARWNIRVKHAYQGLLWVGGPQVDPGYVGHLFCPIYNLSDRPRRLEYDEELAVIDFEKTTPFRYLDCEKEPHQRYQRPHKRLILEDFGIEHFRSALVTNAMKRLDGVESDQKRTEERVKDFGSRFDNFTGLVITVIGILVAAISLAATNITQMPPVVSILWAIPFGISVFAACTAWLALYRLPGASQVSMKRPVGISLVALLFSFLLGAYLNTQGLVSVGGATLDNDRLAPASHTVVVTPASAPVDSHPKPVPRPSHSVPEEK